MGYALTDEQIKFYRDNGYVLVKGLLSPEEAAAYRKETHELADRLFAKRVEMNAAWKSGQEAVPNSAHTVIYHCHDVQFQSAKFGQLIIDNRITDVAADIMETPNVQLHHTKMFIKPPEKGAPFPMHQDAPYFPHDKHSMIAVILHFNDAPIEKGCVRVVPGSHKLGMLEHNKQGGWHLPISDYPVESAIPMEAEAGDALFFSYLTIHGSGVNVSSEARTTLLIQMRDPEDPPSIETHLSQGQGQILRGILP